MVSNKQNFFPKIELSQLRRSYPQCWSLKLWLCDLSLSLWYILRLYTWDRLIRRHVSISPPPESREGVQAIFSSDRPLETFFCSERLTALGFSRLFSFFSFYERNRARRHLSISQPLESSQGVGQFLVQTGLLKPFSALKGLPLLVFPEHFHFSYFTKLRIR